MTVILALEHLYDGVVAQMAADAAAQEPPATPVPQPFGWRSPARNDHGPRIVWVPGDDTSGAIGDVAGAKYPGRNPRPLATLHELFTVYLEGVDTSAPENERAQYKVARLLFDAWYRAAHLVAHGTFQIRSVGWLTGKKERRRGATIRVLVSVEAMVADAPLTLAPVDTRAAIDVEELDESETMTTPITVLAATTGPIDLEGEQLVDGALATGARVLVKDQADASENGLYVVAAGAWERTGGPLEHGLVVHAYVGETNARADFLLTTPDPIEVGTTEITFVRITA